MQVRTTKRVYNFSAGPATLPESILKEAQSELLNWNDLGISMLELGHRTEVFENFMHDAEVKLRNLLGIPEHYSVLFLGGAARTQFSMIPLNILGLKQSAAYLVSGIWSAMAYAEASKLVDSYCVGSAEAANYTLLPEYIPETVRENTGYLYYTTNETVNGVRFPFVPQCKEAPLVADMTSSLLTEPIDVSNYGLIFAGAQKNIANAGLTLVIIRNELLERVPRAVIPTMMDYRVHVKNNSLYATPPVFNCYLASKMFDWIKLQGGVDALFATNQAKAQKLYQAIDTSPLYACPIEKSARSLVNVCFTINRRDREADFIAQAEARGLYGLKGHRIVGGLRASIYNAMPMSGVDALIEFMHDFETKL